MMENNYWIIFTVYAILAYSISNFFVFAHGPFHIFDKIREWANETDENLGELFQCMICFPFWVGFILSIGNTVFMPSVEVTPVSMCVGSDSLHWFTIAFLDGIVTSGIVWLIHTAQEALERSNQTSGE